MEVQELKPILEAMIMASSQPLTVDKLLGLFPEDARPEKKAVREALEALAGDYADSSVELKEVASGWRFQVRQRYAEWVTKLWEEKPPRYSRALLETMALIAYKQPITRAEIEKIRGVTVSTQIVKTLQEREWVQVVGHRDVPGKPALYATTKAFLDYFNLKNLEELPPLAEIRDIDQVNAELDLGEGTAMQSNEVEQQGDSDTGVVELGVEDEEPDAESSGQSQSSEPDTSDAQDEDPSSQRHPLTAEN